MFLRYKFKLDSWGKWTQAAWLPFQVWPRSRKRQEKKLFPFIGYASLWPNRRGWCCCCCWWCCWCCHLRWFPSPVKAMWSLGNVNKEASSSRLLFWPNSTWASQEKRGQETLDPIVPFLQSTPLLLLTFHRILPQCYIIIITAINVGQALNPWCHRR